MIKENVQSLFIDCQAINKNIFCLIILIKNIRFYDFEANFSVKGALLPEIINPKSEIVWRFAYRGGWDVKVFYNMPAVNGERLELCSLNVFSKSVPQFMNKM